MNTVKKQVEYYIAQLIIGLNGIHDEKVTTISLARIIIKNKNVKK
ncbi:MAG: hypothetical protein ACTSPI_11670 [Candidatus Heimdallarchaeaceae archaeon]